MVGKKLSEFLGQREKDPLAYYASSDHDGVAPFEDPKDRLDKSVREAAIILEFCASFMTYFGSEILAREAGEDPPDFYGVIDGQRYSIELTELIDSEFRKQQKQAFKQGLRLDLNTSYGVTRPFWNEALFRASIMTRLETKSRRYMRPTNAL